MHPVEGERPSVSPLKRRWSAFRSFCKDCFVICGFVGGGVSIGYFIGVQQQKQDSLAEIERLQQAYGRRIESAAGAVTDAAKATSSAAEAVGDAADQVGAAAQTAKTAAITAKAAAKATGAPAPAAVVNNEIRKANQKLQGPRQ
jgi:hypothetical protein